MEGGFNFLAMAPPVFDGDNYQMWAVRMETYLEALDLWEAVEEGSCRRGNSVSS